MDDREIARHALDLQARARDVRLLDIPAYKAWSNRKLDEGTPEEFIAHLDATSMSLLPEETDKVTEVVFEEMLADLRAEVKRWEQRNPLKP